MDWTVRYGGAKNRRIEGRVDRVVSTVSQRQMGNVILYDGRSDQRLVC